jgi:hypothetical protein
MKNDSTTIFLNIVLAALVLLGVVFALMSIARVSKLHTLQAQVQVQGQKAQKGLMLAQQLLQDTVTFNNTARNPELNQILQSAK